MTWDGIDRRAPEPHVAMNKGRRATDQPKQGYAENVRNDQLLRSVRDVVDGDDDDTYDHGGMPLGD